jgi:hypothetical protein
MSSLSVEPGLLQESKSNDRALLRVLPSFSDFAFLFPIATLFLLLQGARTILADGDTGWQIRTGDWILQNGRVPHTDLFSFTKSGQSWFAWEWLWDVIFSLIHRASGLSGVVLANTLILSVISVLLYRLVRRHASNDARALVVTLAAMCATAIHWLGRPHLLSWVLLLAALHLIDRAQEGRTQLLWWFPLLVAFWANVHGSFPLALLLLFTYGAVNTIQDVAHAGFHDLWPALRRHRIWFLACAASLAASLLNPYGWHLHQHIALYLADAKQLNSISEFMPFDFHSSLAICVEAFLILGGCAAIACFRQGRWAQAIILLVWAHLAFKSARNVPIFVFLAAPAIAEWITAALESVKRAPVAKWLRELSEDLLSFGKDFHAFERVGRLPFIPVGAGLLLALLLGIFPGGRQPIADFDARDFPVAATRLLAKHPDARVFTFDQWGGYLIYRLYPKMRVFADDRSDFYGADYLQEWVKALKARFDWRKELTRYSIDTVLLATDDPLSSVLKETREWKPVFDDGRAIVFEKR